MIILIPIHTDSINYHAPYNIQNYNNTMLSNNNSSTALPQISRWTSFLFWGLYFLQGTVTSLAATMPYIYPTLPSYNTLALFTAADLPFSLKFLIAPFLQKYTSIDYGKRKTWIVVSQLICGVTLLIAGSFTGEDQSSLLAFLLFIATFFITIQDIELDSLAIKQMRCPDKTSTIQAISQICGVLFGGLLLLKLTSVEFANKIGLQQKITSVDVIFISEGILLLVLALLVHFFFKQTQLQDERHHNEKPLCQIITYNSTFFDLRSRYCRTGIFFLIYCQGLNFYSAGYDYQLIRAGFSRDTSNSISNLINIPILFLTAYMASWSNFLGTARTFTLIIFLLSILYSILLITFPVQPWIVAIALFLTESLSTWRFVILFIMINTFPVHALSGMFITVLASLNNFGRLKTVNTKIIGVFGWRCCAFIGLAFQIALVCCMPRMLKWIENGSLDVGNSPGSGSGSLQIKQQQTIEEQRQKLALQLIVK